MCFLNQGTTVPQRVPKCQTDHEIGAYAFFSFAGRSRMTKSAPVIAMFLKNMILRKVYQIGTSGQRPSQDESSVSLRASSRTKPSPTCT